MPPNTLREYTEYVLVKSVGPKVLWAAAAETTSSGGWRIFTSSPVSSLNYEGRDRRCAICRKVQPVSQAVASFISSIREFHRANSYCHLYGSQGQGRQAYI
ncbi:hypothetical protein TNCV_1507631 [Trichonephila clavipes]|nr:hypothetical protein TNCV_1507631 [Trichonephila clavipes]